jgi:hypothetical protein
VATAAAVGLVFVLGRCAAGSGPAAAPADPPDLRAQVAKTLAARVQAVQDDDKAAYLATDADSPWKAADGTRFDNLQTVPFASWTLTLSPDATGVAHVFKVQQSYELSGIDEQPVSSTEYYSFEQHGSAWLLSGDSGGAAAGLHSDVQIWDQGPVSVVHGSRSLVLGLGGEQRLRTFADLADHGAAKAVRVWGAAGWKGTVVMEVPDSEAQVEALLGEQPGDLAGVVAVTAGETGKSLREAPASRVLINPDAFAQQAPDAWSVYIDHELTHVATRSWTTDQVPMWLSEGAADYSGYLSSGITGARMLKELKVSVDGGWAPGELPTSADFNGSGDDVSRTYQVSNLACKYIADHYGQAKLVAFYEAVGTAPEGSADPVGAAFRSVLGTTEKDFTAHWKAYVLARAHAA